MSEAVKHETVLDTGAMQLGRIYARALIGSADAQGVSDQVLGELADLVDNVLGEHSNLAAAIASPRVSEAEKNRVLDRLLSDKVHPVLLKFLKVACSRGRLGYLAEIRTAAEDLQNELLGRVVAEVQTAHPLDDALRGEIKHRVASSIGKEVLLKESVNPDLIGGLVVRIGDTVYDSSVAGKLDGLSRQARDGFARRLMESTDSFASGS